MSRFKVLFLLFAVSLSAAIVSADAYWISIGDGGSMYMMQIDENGNILTPLTAVGSNTLFPSGCQGTAMTQTGNPDQLIIWTNQSGKIARSFFSKSQMQILATTKIPLNGTGRSFIQSTQKDIPDFFMFATGKSIAKGFGSKSDGSWDGTRWRISPGTDKSLFNAGVSPDGLMVWAAAHNSSFSSNHLYTQPLDSNGLPKGSMKGVANLDQVQAASISNPLHDGTRIIAYRMFRSGQFIPVSTDNLVIVQKIDAVTGSPVGERKVITSTAYNCQSHVINIDPDARFVLFIKQDFNCGRDVLEYQALDSAGTPTGPIEELIGCSDGIYVGSMNMLKEE